MWRSKNKTERVGFNQPRSSKLFAQERDFEKAQEDPILDAKGRHDSVGGVVLTVARDVPKGLGEPIYYKLDAMLANAYDEYQTGLQKACLKIRKMGLEPQPNLIMGKFQK